MIEVLVLKNSKNEYVSVQLIGHAEFADPGEDIVCAGVSALVITTINSIEKLTNDPIQTISDEEEGLISMNFEETPGHDSTLLLDSMVIGLQDIQENYGNEYIQIIFEEV